MRFVCDNDVDAAVARTLRRLGHEAWTVGMAGLARASDDDLTVYAHEKSAALMTHDEAFSKRRRRNVIGQHIWLRCVDLEAVSLVEKHIDEIVQVLSIRGDLWVKVSNEGIDLGFDWR